MPGKTQITIVGNAGSDAELRYTPSGQAVTNFSLAVTPRTFDRNSDQWIDGDTTWYRVNAWRTLAENVAETIQKGTRVIVMGSLELRQWEDTEGNTRSSLEVTADALGPDLMFVSAKLNKSERNAQGDPPDWATDPEPEPEPRRTTKPSPRTPASTRKPQTSRR